MHFYENCLQRGWFCAILFVIFLINYCFQSSRRAVTKKRMLSLTKFRLVILCAHLIIKGVPRYECNSIVAFITATPINFNKATGQYTSKLLCLYGFFRGFHRVWKEEESSPSFFMMQLVLLKKTAGMLLGNESFVHILFCGVFSQTTGPSWKLPRGISSWSPKQLISGFGDYKLRCWQRPIVWELRWNDVVMTWGSTMAGVTLFSAIERQRWKWRLDSQQH